MKLSALSPNSDHQSRPIRWIFSIFSSQIVNNIEPLIFEDGNQTRDFIFVEDVASANITMLTNDFDGQEAFNVGTGKGTSVN